MNFAKHKRNVSHQIYTDEDLNSHNHLRWLYVLIHLSATFPLNDINSTPKRADLNLQRCKRVSFHRFWKQCMKGINENVTILKMGLLMSFKMGPIEVEWKVEILMFFEFLYRTYCMPNNNTEFGKTFRRMYIDNI